MTCIVGIKAKDNVFMGSDTLGSTSYTKVERSDPKVFMSNGFLIGCAHSFRMAQLLRFELRLPAIKKTPIDEYMVTKFIPEVENLFKKHSFNLEVPDVDGVSIFLVGYQNRLFTIENDFQVGENRDGFDACGAGEDYARGALYAMNRIRTDGSIVDIEDNITIALEAATKFNPYVGSPFVILNWKAGYGRKVKNHKRGCNGY